MTMPGFQSNIYKTKDLAEASALILKDMKFVDIEREGRICWFLFENRQECENLSRQFFFGEVMVNARNISKP